MATLATKGPSGRKMQFTAPTGGIAINDIVSIRTGVSGQCGIALTAADAAAQCTVEYGHQVEVPKNTGTGESFAEGALVYKDASTEKATATATGNDLMGFCIVTAGTAATTVWVQLKVA